MEPASEQTFDYNCPVASPVRFSPDCSLNMIAIFLENPMRIHVVVCITSSSLGVRPDVLGVLDLSHHEFSHDAGKKKSYPHSPKWMIFDADSLIFLPHDGTPPTKSTLLVYKASVRKSLGADCPPLKPRWYSSILSGSPYAAV
jgi:hypothetical protein